MANLQKCSRCKCTLDISYFGINRKKEPYKTCESCRNKINKTSIKEIKYKPSVPIDATDIASLLGLHKYKRNYYDIVMKYWERSNFVDYRDIYDELKNDGVVFEIVETAEDKIMKYCDDKKLSFNFETINDVKKLQEILLKEKDLNVDETDIHSFCNTQMGIQFEDNVKCKYENKIKEKIEDVSKYHKRCFYEDDMFKWFVGGRVDGLTSESKKIIEIKNRKNGIYPCIPLYEIIQVYTYMYIHELNQATIVEQYNNEIEETHFIYSQGYESYVLSRLKSFCLFISDFMKDKNLRIEFMKCGEDDKNKIERFNNLIIDKLQIREYFDTRITPIKNQIINP